MHALMHAYLYATTEIISKRVEANFEFSNMNGKLNENIRWLIFAMKECFILTTEGQGLGSE